MNATLVRPSRRSPGSRDDRVLDVGLRLGQGTG